MNFVVTRTLYSYNCKVILQRYQLFSNPYLKKKILITILLIISLYTIYKNYFQNNLGCFIGGIPSLALVLEYVIKNGSLYI